jgi:DNA-binding MarR family transcriptional regulator
MDALPLTLELQRAVHLALRALDGARLGVGAAEANTLGCFGTAGERRVRELVAATGQRPSTLTGVLDRLEERGLVHRRPDPEDRRTVLVALTAAGRAARDRVLAAMGALEAEVPAAEARRLRGALARFPAQAAR